jgi:hypothetical protein
MNAAACLLAKVSDACVKFGEPSARGFLLHHLPIDGVRNDRTTGQQRTFYAVAEVFV